MNQIIYSVIITLSFLLCNDAEKYRFKNNVDRLIKENDFRKKGKHRFDSALIGFYENHHNKDIKKIIDIIESSRYLETIKKKIKNI